MEEEERSQNYFDEKSLPHGWCMAVVVEGTSVMQTQ